MLSIAPGHVEILGVPGKVQAEAELHAGSALDERTRQQLGHDDLPDSDAHAARLLLG
jgi:hypothetical protein